LGFRILAVNWQDLKNPLAGGAEVHLQEILSRLGQWGHEVSLLCSGFDSAAAEENYDHQRIVRRGQRMNFNWVAPWHARRLLAERKFDVILEDINKIPFYLPLFTDIPLLAIVPHLFATTVFHEINPILASYIYLMEKPVSIIYKKHPWMVISESTKTDLVGRGIPAEQVTVIHCGIDHQLYAPDSQVHRFDRPTILYLGRLKKYKSVDHILLAAARMRAEVGDWRVVVIGEGDDRRRLEKIAGELGIEKRVEFTGFVDQQTKVDYLRRAQVAVCASLKEGWGLTNIEANACGTPVIAADVPGLRDSVRDGKTGLLFPYGDIDSLSERLTRLLTDHVLGGKLSAGGLEWAESFHWNEAARATESLIEQVVNRKLRPGGRL
jgi:glycosyltransferase involved in cell wall biosynthesis